MTLFSRIAEFPVQIETIDFIKHEQDTSSDFTRKTTEIILSGKGKSGRGEDVTYEADEHDAVDEQQPDFPLAGAFTLGDFSELLEEMDLFFGRDPGHKAFCNYRRWGFESAALDLALKQAGTNLAKVFGLQYNPVEFVVSTRLGDSPSMERLEQLLKANSELKFKLDPTPEWTPDLMDQIAATDTVRILDFKGLYENTIVDNPPEPWLYRELIARFPDAVIEDPADTEEIRKIIAPEKERLSWDYPVKHIQSIEELPFSPRWLNIKPSRFGSLKALLDTIDYCRKHEITMYGGGQFELSVGRDQIQGLASLFYPDSPNDVAPGVYNMPEVTGTEAPLSPLKPADDLTGFEWKYDNS
ncbi:MAG: hypothetical protein K9N46_09470 [Candidatus Marinimicrobia bacterium]|nr:hypothetical protein [Candidatus Neomarinimicrobiota bacterium]MCF7828453.1 hypothetical protein [Candidatus Neomarinimicrobiota bacterium]MCF7880953.1 hypothetical protein [Candidatus Neomarinimicrobiota bacterium]